MKIIFIALLWPRKGLNWLIQGIRVTFSKIVQWIWTFIGSFFRFLKISSFLKRCVLLVDFHGRKVRRFSTLI
jgi:hypothetical protein